ncbi:MAG: Gfo/Idh/MocA family oxidoreductase, partial [Acidimicrobiia bacterium]|nr:Gfo/Idh/MocA family oxidoreductase [Acidimicrobiia bacterium]
VYISATPETLHYPMCRAALVAGKHVLLEKPISMTPGEADELIQLAEDNGLKFTIGYSQRFNPKQAFAKKAMAEGKLGDPVSILVSRNVTRRLGNKIGGRVKLTPASMEATHDIDFAMWLLEPRRPVRVYSQLIWGVLKEPFGIADGQAVMVTMDDGVTVNVQSGWNLPPGWPNFSTTQIEVIGKDGALLMDDSHKDVIFNTVDDGVQFPMSSMPGEFVGETYAGPMERETTHFLEAVAFDRPVMVEPRLARVTMDIYLAADLSAERGEAVQLPMEADEMHDALVASIGAELASELA